MKTLALILLIILILYGCFILRTLYGCLKIKPFSSSSKQPKNSFSVVVPFRNEKENLQILIHSLSNLNYPKDLFEVILVDDDSEESFPILNTTFSLSVIPNHRKSASPKKDAIETAIQKANFNWIVTTDADCVFSENWLLVLDNFIQEYSQAKMVCGMVFTQKEKSFLKDFQLLDFMSLQSATIGGFGIGKAFMCNGANFAYTKDFFAELDGFSGNQDFAGGDDVFLLQKAAKIATENLFYLRAKENLVLTKPAKRWSAFLSQRIRWASKTKGYQSSFAKQLAIAIFLGNLGFLAALLGLFFSGYFLGFILLKITLDLLLIRQTSSYVPALNKLSIILSCFVYPFVSSAIAIYILFFKRYNWKGRTYKI